MLFSFCKILWKPRGGIRRFDYVTIICCWEPTGGYMQSVTHQHCHIHPLLGQSAHHWPLSRNVPSTTTTPHISSTLLLHSAKLTCSGRCPPLYTTCMTALAFPLVYLTILQLQNALQVLLQQQVPEEHSASIALDTNVP